MRLELVLAGAQCAGTGVRFSVSVNVSVSVSLSLCLAFSLTFSVSLSVSLSLPLCACHASNFFFPVEETSLPPPHPFKNSEERLWNKKQKNLPVPEMLQERRSGSCVGRI